MSARARGARISWLSLFVLATGALALLASSAAANHGLKELLSTGTSGGNGPYHVTYQTASQDGTHVFFTTDEALVPADTDTATDVYERSNGVTSLVSVGDQGGSLSVSFVAASPDGTHVLFKTADSLVLADTDGTDDIYERAGGTTTLFPSSLAAASSSAVDYTIGGYSQDGSKLFFTTSKQLVPGDTDSGADVYERSAGGLSLLSTGPNGGNGPNSNLYSGSTPDGAHVYFVSNESLVSTDTDTATDVYERWGGTTTLISIGPDGGNGNTAALFRGATPNGSNVYFITIESLVSADADGGGQDVYDRSGTTTTLDSTGPGGNGFFHADFSAASDDGARVIFRTAEQLASGDTNTANDIYERSAGTTTLISTGSSPCSGPCSSTSFEGSTPDGSRVWFETTQPLESNDTDSRKDVYERSGGITTLVSTGAGTPCCSDMSFHGASQDGTRVFFGTSSSVFERFGGVVTTIAPDASFQAVSLDGKRVLLRTDEKLVLGDTDAAQDIYSISVIPYEVPQAASPINVSLVPVFKQCGPGSNPPTGEHAAPLATRSCLPLATGVAHFGPQAVGSARISATPGDPASAPNEADVSISANVTDVRGASPTGPDYNPNSGGADATLVARWRLTDNSNGPADGDAGSAVEIDFGTPVDCVDTTDPAVGAGCGALTSVNALVPGAIRESRGSVLQIFRVRMTDSGPNGMRGDGDDTLFAQQGIYVP